MGHFVLNKNTYFIIQKISADIVKLFGGRMFGEGPSAAIPMGYFQSKKYLKVVNSVKKSSSIRSTRLNKCVNKCKTLSLVICGH